MPNLQNIVLTDAASPTVDHTFVPQRNAGDVTIVAEPGVTKIGEPSLTITTDIKKAAGVKPRVNLVLNVPMLVDETINGRIIQKVVGNNTVELRFSFAPDSTVQERKNLVAMTASALGSTKTLVYDTLTKLEDIFGG